MATHSPQLFQPLFEAIANRIFTEGNDTYRNQFIEICNSNEGYNVISTGFTSESADPINNYENGEFFGDTLIDTMLANFLINSKVQGLTPAFLTEAKNYIVSASGQYDMFKEYRLGEYLRVGEVFKQDYNPNMITLHTYSDLVESLFYIIHQIGEMMGNIGYQLVQNFFNSHMNENRHRFLERLTKSWKAQIEDLGKHYGDAHLLAQIRADKGKGYEANRRFIIRNEQLDDGQYQVTLSMNSDSADNLNNIVMNNPVLRFDGMDALDAKEVVSVDYDKDLATSESYKMMIDYLNGKGYNYGWRILFSRWLELTARMIEDSASNYTNIFGMIINSGRFPYAKTAKLSIITKQKGIHYIQIDYLTQPYKLDYINITGITGKTWYRIDLKNSTVKDPIIAAYLRFYDEFINQPQQQQPAQYQQGVVDM